MDRVGKGEQKKWREIEIERTDSLVCERQRERECKSVVLVLKKAREREREREREKGRERVSETE